MAQGSWHAHPQGSVDGPYEPLFGFQHPQKVSFGQKGVIASLTVAKLSLNRQILLRVPRGPGEGAASARDTGQAEGHTLPCHHLP